MTALLEAPAVPDVAHVACDRCGRIARRNSVARGLCKSCYTTAKRAGALPPRLAQSRGEAIVEDIEWLVETGECWTNAIRRVGSPSSAALDRLLSRAGRYDLISVLRSRESHWFEGLRNEELRHRTAA